MEYVNKALRFVVGMCAGLALLVPLYFVMTWLMWFIACLLAIGIACMGARWACSTGYDKLTDGCASALGFFKRKAAGIATA